MPLYDYLVIHPYGSIEGSPPPPPPQYFYRPDITDVEALSDFITDGLSLGTRIDCVFNNILKAFLLEPGPADGGDRGQVAPEDYNAGTTNVHWAQMGG